MRVRKPSLASRAMEIVPAFAILGVGVLGVILAMNILVTVAPILTSSSSSPKPTFTFPITPSFAPVITSTPSPTPVATASLPDHKPTLVHTQVTDKDPGGVWYYYISYPAFVSGSTPFADSIDAQIADSVSLMVQQWQSGPASVSQAPGKRNNLTGDFEIDLMTPTLSSFTMNWLDDTIASRPARVLNTVNYDMGTGAPLAFDDLFADPSSALDTVSLESRKLLQDQLGAAYDPTLTDPGVAATRTNFTHWALTAEGLKVTFDQEQVAAYSMGTPSVVIPWSVLKPFMVTTGPIAALAAGA